ncbi:MAG: SGNH/GDSL hydrolase family protein [Kiritimatiellae bacterium]|nr:SGNH/GDSL hydrolase family protein [Kiritimatiellia bacterium]
MNADTHTQHVETDSDWSLLKAAAPASGKAAPTPAIPGGLPKVVLLGDSIRLGYQEFVRNALQGEATVLFPPENCRFSQYLLRFVANWKTDGQWGDDAALVHWNAGLWDCLRVDGEPPMTPLPFYREMLGRTHRRLRRHFPEAKLVFATTTPVIEAGYRQPERFARLNSEIADYNAAAREVLTPLGEEFDDLYDVMAGAPDEEHSDQTHWNTPAGTRRIGDAVVRCIRAALCAWA